MRYTFFAAILIFLATIKIIANLMGWEMFSSAVSMSNLTPAMKVFTAHKGYETYTGAFHIQATYKDGEVEEKKLTSAIYANLKGPYNRRNVYGALIAYGPLLVSNPKTKPMYDAMSHSAFCKAPHILSELTFANKPLQQVRISYTNANETSHYPKKIEVTCE